MRSYSIGEVARTTNVTVEALRYYEKQGLLPRLPRSPGGARRFCRSAINRVHFIKQAQAVGLTLKDIRALFEADGRDPRNQCRRTRDVLAARVAEIDERLASIRTFRDLLGRCLDACEQALADGAANQGCPTLERGWLDAELESR